MYPPFEPSPCHCTIRTITIRRTYQELSLNIRPATKSNQRTITTLNLPLIRNNRNQHSIVNIPQPTHFRPVASFNRTTHFKLILPTTPDVPPNFLCRRHAKAAVKKYSTITFTNNSHNSNTMLAPPLPSPISITIPIHRYPTQQSTKVNQLILPIHIPCSPITITTTTTITPIS